MDRRPASSIDHSMDDLLEEMGRLADEAGDWREHLPYAAAAGFHDDVDFQERYGAHVDECRYCQGLIDALHPGEETVAKLLSHTHEMPLPEERPAYAAGAVAEARWVLDGLRGVVVEQPARGTLREWASSQQWLTYANQALEGPDSSALSPWLGTVMLSLDAVLNPIITETRDDRLGNAVEDVASFLLAFGYRVAHAGDPRSGSISTRICDLAPHYGRRKTPTQLGQTTTFVQKMEFGVTGYCVGSAHINAPAVEVKTYDEKFGQQGIVKWLTLEGETRPYSYFAESDGHEVLSYGGDSGLTAIRNTMVHESLACIVVGGSTVVDHKTMPSVAQDALVSLRDRRPLYVLGGFGGCAQDIAAFLGLTNALETTHYTWSHADAFSDYRGPIHLHNGLDELENRTLAETDDAEAATRLILLGLERVRARQRHRPLKSFEN